MICQLDSIYYDPTYRAKSTEMARSNCKSDRAELAEVTTEEDVKEITKDMLVDTPHWINSISSKGSKIKQCLVAKLVGDDLKYSYEDCSQEYHFICVEGDDIMSSFLPLISLMMARFEEFEEEIEKLSPTTAIFDLFSSSEIPLESSSINVPVSLTSTFPPTMTPEITPSNQITSTSISSPIQYTTSSTSVIPNVQSEMTYADVISSTQSDVAPSVQPHVTPAGVTSSVQPQLSPTDVTSSVQVAAITTDVISSVQTMDTYDDISETETVVTTSSVSRSNVDSPLATYTILTTAPYTDTTTTMDKESSSEADIFSLTMLDKDPVTITSSVISTDVSTTMDVLQPSETTQNIVQITIDSVDNLSSSSIDVTDIQTASINANTDETMRVTFSSSQTVESSSIDTLYRENVFIEPQNSSVTIQFSSDMVMPMSTTVTSSSSKYSPLLTFVNTTGYYRSPTDTSINTDTELFVIQATQTVPSKLSSSSYFENFDTYEPENTTPTDRLDMGEVSTTHTTSDGVLQTPDIIIEPSSTLTVMPSKSSSYEENDFIYESISSSENIHTTTAEFLSSTFKTFGTEDSKTSSHMSTNTIFHFTSLSSSQDAMATQNTNSYAAHATGSSLNQITSKSSLMPYECTEIDSTTLCGDMLTPPDDPYTLDVLESSSTILNFITPSMTYSLTDVPLSSSLTASSLSTYPAKHLSSYSYITTEDITNIEPEPSLSSVSPSNYNYYDSERYDSFDEDDDKTFSPENDPTPKYTIGTSDEDETDQVDENIPGDLDKDDMDEDNAIGNASADKGEIVDEEEGTEIGLWIAFAILITLVSIALILAAFLYRKRKQQKSKDINTAAPPAAAGETVELRDSRSPSRENGKPREATTYKDPAYDI